MRSKYFFVLLLFFSLIPTLYLRASYKTFQEHDPNDPFYWTYDLQTRDVKPGAKLPFEATISIPQGSYLYQEKVALTIKKAPEGSKVLGMTTSPAIRKVDSFSGKEMEILVGDAFVKAEIQIPSNISEKDDILTLDLAYQGCSSKLCYRLTHMEVKIPLNIISDGENTNSSPFQSDWFVIGLLISLITGLGSAFTPCVLPIIPITLAFIGVRKDQSSTRSNFFLSLVLVLAMALTYAVLGLIVALFGKSVGFLYQNVYFLLFGVVLFVTFSLSMFGLFEIQVPLALRNKMAHMGGKGVVGAIISGMTVGFLAAPCVGPLIGSLLLYVAKSQNLIKGFSFLFAYGVGMGLPFLLIGTFYYRVAGKIHGGPYLVWIKRVLAILLLIPAFYYGSIIYTHFQSSRDVKTNGGVEDSFWIKDANQGFEKAQKEGKPVFIDFFANWCLPCLKMDKTTFQDPELRKLLSSKYVAIKVDCTEETSECKKMTDRFEVIGWPTFILADKDGKLIQKWVGEEMSATDLISALQKSMLPLK